MQGNAGRRTNFRSGSWSSKLVLEVGPRPWDGRCQMIVLVLASLLLGRMPCLGRGIPTRKSGRNFPHSIAVFADYCSLRGAHSPGHRPAPRPKRAATRRALSTRPQPMIQHTDGHTYSQGECPRPIASMHTNQRPNIRWAYGRNERASHQQ